MDLIQMTAEANASNFFRVLEVPSRSAIAPETLGTKPKFWFDADGVRYLFKNDDRGTGEDWAEKIVCEIAVLIGLPHVPYELAQTTDRSNAAIRGVCSANLCASGESLVMGNQLLGFKDPSYPVVPRKIYKVREHGITAVWDVLSDSNMGPPSARWMVDAPSGVQSAGDVFVGYVLLDALVGNQDRHHQN